MVAVWSRRWGRECFWKTLRSEGGKLLQNSRGRGPYLLQIDSVLEKLLRALAEDLRSRGKLDLTEAYGDGSHAGAKRGVLLLGSLAAAKRPRSWQWQTAMAFLSPLGLRVVSEMSRSSSLKP